MKFATALSLGMAPVALAKAVHNVYPGRRDAKFGDKRGIRVESISVQEISLEPSQEFLLEQVAGQDAEIELLEEALLLWVNPGASAATTLINAQPTGLPAVGSGSQALTQTVVGGAVGASQTIVTGATSTVAATGATHSVVVGGTAGLQYSPSSIEAAVGDTVLFTFMSQNHTVTQSAFTTPCDALAGGMDSGFQANANNSVNPPPQVAMQVQVATPLWFYCRQTGHCGKGMTFSINPTANKTQALFQAMAISQNGTGGGSAITGNGNPSGSSSIAVGSASLTATLGGLATATQSVGSTATGIVSGTGQLANGQCVCSVQCGTGSFPSIEQGVNNFGGFSGAIPAGSAETV